MGVVDKFKAEGQCRLCERPARGNGGRALTRHRLVPGRHGGRYVTVNCIPLCRPCHDEVEEQDPVARRMLRPKLWPVEIAYVIKTLGEQWFELMYPRPAAMGLQRYQVDELARAPRPTIKRTKSWDPRLTDISRSEKSLARSRGRPILDVP